MLRKKKTITLVELLISITLLVMVVLGTTAFDLASRRFLRMSEDETRLLNELGLVLDHIERNVSMATGDFGNTGVQLVANGFRVRQDINPCTGAFLNSPDIYVDLGNACLSDRWVTYTFALPNVTATVPPAAAITLTPHLVQAPVIQVGAAVQGGVQMSGLALDDGNERVTLLDTTGNATIYFYPLMHSWR